MTTTATGNNKIVGGLCEATVKLAWFRARKEVVTSQNQRLTMPRWSNSPLSCSGHGYSMNYILA